MRALEGLSHPASNENNPYNPRHSNDQYIIGNNAASSSHILLDPSAHAGIPALLDLSTNRSIDVRSQLEQNRNSQCYGPLQQALGTIGGPGSVSLPDINATDIPDDFVFLEDFLLPNVANAHDFPPPLSMEDHQIHLQRIRSSVDTASNYSHPTLTDGGVGVAPPGYSSDSSYSHVFYISEDDVAELQKRIYQHHSQGLLDNFSFPKHSRVVRCLTAYFDHFDPHTPIIQYVRPWYNCGVPVPLL